MKFDKNFREIKIRHIIIMFLFLFLISLVIGIILIKVKGEISDRDTNIVGLLMQFLLIFMMFFVLRLSRKNIKLLYEDFKSNLNVKEIILIILFITLLEIGSDNILIDISYNISPNFASWFASNHAMAINSINDYWIVLAIVILAPFTDEIIFRSTLFKRLSKKFNIYVGLIVSSIIFSSFNFSTQMIGIFLLGIVNCILYVKYENILMPMLIYLINNIIGMIIFILFGKFGDQAIILNSTDIVLYAVSGVLLFTIGIIFFVKFINQNKDYLREMNDKNKAIEIRKMYEKSRVVKSKL